MEIQNDKEYQHTKKCVKEMVKKIKKIKDFYKKEGKLTEQQIEHIMAPQISFLLGYVQDARFYLKEKRRIK